MNVRFRMAGPDDAVAVAGLHADSWQRHYRGAYADAFLDGEPDGFLTGRWTERLANPSPGARTIVAEYGGELVGLSHVEIGADATWGALLDNLHVQSGLKRQGVGTQLLALTAQAVQDAAPASGLYLWVLEQNVGAQKFYSARGGENVERSTVPPPGGEPARLIGTPACYRFSWPDPSVLT
ncbi:GNAT family N-acetyltransferase [Kribbella sp. NPDC051952]|uniref:GNAT family N-acetyltransferase n=1 Tax=Kribbella sp. NPDC051952 TaxID=3154851 RepID=UPI003441E25A